MGLFGGTKTTTTTTMADPTTLARQRGMWDTASQLASQPYQAYGGDQVAGFSNDQFRGFQAARDAAGVGAGTIGAGVNAAQGAANYNPMNIDPRTAGPAAQAMSPGDYLSQYQLAIQNNPTAHARDVTAQDAVGGISQYLNPYTNQVVDSSLSDLDRQRQMAIQQGQAAATAAGAYGGSRHGVADSLTNEAALRAAGALSGQLRSQGFNTALGAATNDANRNLQGQMANQGADVATSIANAQNATSLTGQGLNTAANLGMYNAGQQNNMSQFNAQLGANADYANQQAGLAGNAQHLAAGSALGQLGQGEQNNALAGADALLKVGGQQQGLKQAQLSTDYNNWLQEQNDPYRKLQFQQSFTGTPGQIQTNKKPTGGLLGSALGVVGGIAGGPLGGLIGKGIGDLFGGGGGASASDIAGTNYTNLAPWG